MMKLILTITLTLCIVFPAFAQTETKKAPAKNSRYPRQTVTLSGLLKKGKVHSFTVKEIEQLNKEQKTLKINDPYNRNIETTFYGIDFYEFISNYGSARYKKLIVHSIDGYKLEIPRDDIKGLGLFMTYKDQDGYLTVDRMGPVRLVATMKGKKAEDILVQDGVFWVWQLKLIEFEK